MADGLTYLWPSAEQRLLLNAALLDPRQAQEAYSRWKERRGSTGAIDHASLRMLPLVFENLKTTDCQDMGQLRQWRRHFWVQGQGQRRATFSVVSLLGEAGIPTLVGKGMALELGGYVLPGTRPKSDIDLYVRYEDALAAIDCLEAAGWRDQCPFQEAPRDRIRRTPSMMMRHETMGELDLHWHCLSWIRKRSSDDRIWNDAQQLVCEGINIRIPAANDLILHAIVHGIYRNVFSPFRWIADVVVVCRAAPEGIDWRRQAEIARDLKLYSRWRRGVDYLAENYPEDCVIPKIARQRTTLVEIIENWDAVAGPDRLDPLDPVRGFLAYAVRIADGDNRHDLVRLTVRQMVRKLKGWLRYARLWPTGEPTA